MPNQGGTVEFNPSPLRMFAGVKGFLIYERNSSGTEINLSICWCKK